VLMGSPGVPEHPQAEALRRPLGGPASGQNPLIKETPVFQEVPALVGMVVSNYFLSLTYHLKLCITNQASFPGG
jgi:hypothetical protein